MRTGRAMLLAATVLLARSVGAQATILGTVFDSLRTAAPLQRATVVIPELSRYATTDELGRFQMDSVPAGHYSITFLHPVLDSLDVSAEAFPITVPDKGTITARLATPSPAALVWLICRTAADAFPAMLLGHVRSADDSAGLAGATVTVSWSELVMGAVTIEQRTVHAEALTRASGSYVLCGVPLSLRLEVVVKTDERSTGALSFSLNGEFVGHRDFWIGRPTAGATVSGTVRDTRGNPAPNASVKVAGPSLRTVTDAAGRFVIRGVPSGTQVFEAKQLGAWPVSTLINVPQAGTQEISLALGPRAPGLPPPRPTVGATPDDDTGFEDRRLAGIGQFVVPGAQEGKPPKTLTQLLLRASWLFRSTSGWREFVKMHRPGRADCLPNYFVNGYPWRAGFQGLALTEISQALEPADIRGIEVYDAGAIPPIFDRRNGCGAIALWTR
jgi:carboxypeptidase family protein